MLAICPVCDKRFDHHEIDNGTNDRMECSPDCVEKARKDERAATVRILTNQAPFGGGR